MTPNLNGSWAPTGLFKDLFGEYVVVGNRHTNTGGEIAWHLRIFRNNGELSQPRQYWVQGQQFETVLSQSLADDGRLGLATGEVVEVSNEAEKAAMLAAIDKWKNLQ